jgi:ubiquinone biosynthesis protein UbiJ
MDEETRAAFAALAGTVNAGFGRVDRYFELQQAQFVEWRDELRGDVAGLRTRLDALTDRVDRLEREVALLRDFVTREIAEIRLELRELRAWHDQSDRLRRELAALSARVDRLEREA